MVNKSKIIVCLLALCLFLNMASPAFTQDKKVIRVAILQDAGKLYLNIHGKFKIFALGTNDILLEGNRIRTSLVIPKAFGITIGKQDFKICCIRIVPQSDATIYLNDRRFRGEINLIRTQNLKLTVVNVLDIDDYVRGVLYHEVSHLWQLEAIKAQAVATRTFALYQASLNKNKDFDVTSDIYSQVYGGKTSERFRTNTAVSKTKGEVLYYKGAVLPAFFSATCAGHTEDAANLWKIDLTPLKGVVCNFCFYSPHYYWRRNFRLKNIEEKLKKANHYVDKIKEIRIIKRNSSGRVDALEIISRDGRRIYISGKDFRQIIGPNELKSNNYEIAMKGYYVDFLGHGWGHGVGFCQWGAKRMAEKRYNYQQILKYYYPGVEIIKK